MSTRPLPSTTCWYSPVNKSMASIPLGHFIKGDYTTSSHLVNFFRHDLLSFWENHSRNCHAVGICWQTGQSGRHSSNRCASYNRHSWHGTRPATVPGPPQGEPTDSGRSSQSRPIGKRTYSPPGIGGKLTSTLWDCVRRSPHGGFASVDIRPKECYSELGIDGCWSAHGWVGSRVGSSRGVAEIHRGCYL